MLTIAGHDRQRVWPHLALEDRVQAVFDRVHAGDAGADDRGGARPLQRLARKAGLLHGFVGRDEQIFDDRIAERQRVSIEIDTRVEFRNLRGDLDATGIGPREVRFTNAAATVARRLPKCFGAKP